MATRQAAKTTFEVSNVIQPIFTGGSVALENGARILASTLGEAAVLTELNTGKRLAEIEGDGEPISTLTITPSASHLIVCSRSLTMRIYSLKVSPDLDSVEATLVRTSKPHATPVVVLAVDKTSTLLATGAADGAIKIWDIVGGYVTHTVSGPSVLVSALHFFEIAATAGDLPSGKKPKKGSRKNQADEGQAHEGGAKFRLAWGTQDGRIRIFDLHKRTTVPVYADAKRKKEAHESNVQSIDYSPEQHALLSGSRDKTMTLWLWRDDGWQGTPMLRHELVESVGFLNEGKWMYSAGTSGLLRIWDTTTHHEITTKQGAKSEAESILSAISLPHKSLILCAQSDFTLAMYRVPSPADITSSSGFLMEPFRRISGTHDEILDVAYVLPDQSMMALATNSEDIRLVSVADTQTQSDTDEEAGAYFGHDVALLKGHEDIVMSLDVDWSGHWVASGAKDNTARLWRVDPANNSYTCYAVFTGHLESVGAVALPKVVPPESSDAFKNPLDHPPAFLLSGSQDRFVQKRDIPRQSQKSKLSSSLRRLAHDKDINALDVSPSGKLFASASQDKTVKIWDVEALEVQGILRGHKRGVWTVRFAPLHTPAIQGEQGSVSGRGVVLTGSGDKTIKLWSLSDYTCLRTFEGHSHNVLKVVWLHIPTEEGAKRRVQFASAGADSLVKVWDANLGETECTLDNHEDRLWTLAVHPKTNTLVSGGSDSKVTFWKDTTIETQAAATEAALKLVEQEQELENYIHAGAYRDAIILALQLNHPGRLLSLFTNVVTTSNPEEGSLSGLKAVDDVLARLSDEQIFLLLLRLRDWNTNARTAPVAQRILGALVKSYPASKFSNLSVRGARGQKSLSEVLNALKVYTERHYKRMEELVDESYLVEYTLQEMDSLAPPLEALEQGDGDGDGADVAMTGA
ncbi:hypothetical protein VTK26DRAFT_351 [Humicola hyalothermophila]